MKPKYTAVSLFTGAGGLDVGLHRNGAFRLMACVDVQPTFCSTLEANRSAGRLGDEETLILEQDISTLDASVFMDKLGLCPGELDVLVGGPPCQSFSTAGRRRTVADKRGVLLWDFMRFVEVLQPKFFVMENVRGLVSAALRHRSIADRPERGGLPLEPEEQPGSVLDEWVKDLFSLQEVSYRVDCFEVNAVNYGAPQLRERVLFFGNRLGRIVNFPKPTHGQADRTSGRLAAGLLPYKTLRDALDGFEESTQKPVLLDFSPRKKSYLSLVPPGGNWRALPAEIQAESMGKAFHAKGGRSGWWRRLSWDLPCPTIVTMPNHASTSMCHPTEVRVLSVGECARIQEFPAQWQFEGSPQEQYQQVGNAVPVRLGEVAGKLIETELDRPASDLQGEVLIDPPRFRRVYMNSHVRTRSWFKNGEAQVLK